jgi:hypothetical protein
LKGETDVFGESKNGSVAATISTIAVDVRFSENSNQYSVETNSGL